MSLDGQLLDGRYRLDHMIGAGGMARVYQATHTGLARRVAVKVLKPELGRDRDAIERFRREAFASGQLDHPNIVTVSDCGLLADGAMFLAMELLEGESLESRLSREQLLAWPIALELMRGLLAGLAYAHDREIVHCDIKPENIFLAVKHGDASVKLLDFGIARLYSNLEAPISESTIGTPTYMSPEQARGGTLTPASDLYSASVVLYEMLCGMPPFAERTPRDTLLAHLTKPVPAFPPELEIPPQLERLVMNGLAKTPATRVTTAKAYQRELDAILHAAGHAVPGRARTNPPVAPTDFEVLQQLGSTELTDAFIARRPSEPPVVFKRLRTSALDPRIVDSFLAAARVAGRIRDDRVACVVATGGSGESTFVAIDYLPGETLDTIVNPELSIQLAVWILHEAAAALHAAHELCDDGGQPFGFVHGRLTPTSVVVRHSGDVAVVDFEASAGRLLPNRSMSHASPEELVGQPIDRRTDVFALGVVLWEALARRALFPHGAKRETPRLSAVISVPAELDHIVTTALSSDPELRYQTAEALRVALAGFLRRTQFTGGTDALAEYLQAVIPERVEAGRRWTQAASTGDALPLLAPLPSKIRRAPVTTVMARKRSPLVVGGVAVALALVGGAFAISRLATDRTEPTAVATVAIEPPPPVTPPVPPTKERTQVTSDVATRKTDVDSVRRLVAEIDLAIIERRFVAPTGHNALEYLTRLRTIDPSNAASRLLGTEVASALVKEARANPTESRKLLDAAKQARGETKVEEPNRGAKTAELLAKARRASSAGNVAEAGKAYEAAVANEPMSHAALAGLAELAYDQGDFGRAVQSAKRAVALAPRGVSYRMTLAKAYFKLLRYDDAITQWKAVLEVDPSNDAARRNIEMANARR